MKNAIITAGILILLSGCATIGPEHAEMSHELEKGVVAQENAYMRLVDRFEADARLRVDQKLRYFEGPEIMKRATKKYDFDTKVCEQEGELDKAHALLVFTMAASRSYERRKAKYIKPLEKLVAGLRATARERFTAMRQGAAALTSGLRAYNKDKAWRKEMLKSLNVPVDHAEAINKATLEFEKIMDAE